MGKERQSNSRESGKRVSVLATLCDLLNSWEAHDRVHHPHRFVGSADGAGPNFLFAENVAHLLGCSIDYVRRIPRRELPASKIGARLIYQRSDVETFIRSRRRGGDAKASVPNRNGRAKSDNQKTHPAAERSDETFDPVAFVRSLKKGRLNND